MREGGGVVEREAGGRREKERVSHNIQYPGGGILQPVWGRKETDRYGYRWSNMETGNKES